MPSAVSGGLGRSEGQRGEEGSLGVPHRGNGLLLGRKMLPEHWSQPVAGARAGDPAPFLQLVGSRDLNSENPRGGEGVPSTQNQALEDEQERGGRREEGHLGRRRAGVEGALIQDRRPRPAGPCARALSARPRQEPANICSVTAALP